MINDPRGPKVALKRSQRGKRKHKKGLGTSNWGKTRRKLWGECLECEKSAGKVWVLWAHGVPLGVQNSHNEPPKVHDKWAKKAKIGPKVTQQGIKRASWGLKDIKEASKRGEKLWGYA